MEVPPIKYLVLVQLPNFPNLLYTVFLVFFVLSFILYAFYQNEADSSQGLLRTGATPTLEANPADAANVVLPPVENVETPPAPVAPPESVTTPAQEKPVVPASKESSQAE